MDRKPGAWSNHQTDTFACLLRLPLGKLAMSDVDEMRRGILVGAVAALGAALVPSAAFSAGTTGDDHMSSSIFTLKDGVQIYYKDWGKGPPIFFHHGWPLSADDWDAQMLFFLSQG